MRLLDIYAESLASLGRLDSSGELVVRLGGTEPRLPDREACGRLAGRVAEGIRRWDWIVRVEVLAIIALALAGLAILSFSRDRATQLGTLGLDFGFIFSLLLHLRCVWREVTEAEIVKDVVENLPAEDMIRFLELRYSARKEKQKRSVRVREQ